MLSTSNLLPKILLEDALLNPYKNCYFTYFCPYFKYVHIHLQVQFISVNHNTVFHLYIHIYCLQRSRFYIYLIFKQYRLVSIAALCIGSCNAAIVNQHEQRIPRLKVGRFGYSYHGINSVVTYQYEVLMNIWMHCKRWNMNGNSQWNAAATCSGGSYVSISQLRAYIEK